MPHAPSTPTALLAVLLAGGVLLTGCSEKRPMTLTVVSSLWNGWDPDHEPTPETTRLGVEEGAEVTVDHLGDPLEVTITDVDADSADFRTSADMMPEDAGFDDLEDEFTVTVGEPIEFETPSMDAGYNYTVSLDYTD